MTDTRNAAQHAAGDRAIEIFRLTRRFGAFTAVDRVNLMIPYGGIFGRSDPTALEKAPSSSEFLTLCRRPSGKLLFYQAWNVFCI